MILSANQPYFAPNAGFFYKTLLSDTLVILDRVQFPRGTTWVNRNRFKSDKGPFWVTIPIQKKGLGLQIIDKVRIVHQGHWTKKILESLRNAYLRGPFFGEHFPFIEDLFLRDNEHLIEVNMAIIRYLLEQLQIRTKLLLLSELNLEPLKGTSLLIEICQKMGADLFLAQRPAKKYLDLDLFEQAGISLNFFKFQQPVYPQLWGEFIPNLSVFDLLFNCGPKSLDIMTGH